MNIKKVKALMAKQQLTQKALAEKAGVALNVLQLGLNGKRKTSVKCIGRIASALGVEAEEIME